MDFSHQNLHGEARWVASTVASVVQPLPVRGATPCAFVEPTVKKEDPTDDLEANCLSVLFSWVADKIPNPLWNRAPELWHEATMVHCHVEQAHFRVPGPSMIAVVFVACLCIFYSHRSETGVSWFQRFYISTCGFYLWMSYMAVQELYNQHHRSSPLSAWLSRRSLNLYSHCHFWILTLTFFLSFFWLLDFEAHHWSLSPFLMVCSFLCPDHLAVALFSLRVDIKRRMETPSAWLLPGRPGAWKSIFQPCVKLKHVKTPQKPVPKMSWSNYHVAWDVILAACFAGGWDLQWKFQLLTKSG